MTNQSKILQFRKSLCYNSGASKRLAGQAVRRNILTDKEPGCRGNKVTRTGKALYTERNFSESVNMIPKGGIYYEKESRICHGYGTGCKRNCFCC
jgi:hypothetical protein